MSLVFDFSEGSDTPMGESHEETLARLATLTTERDRLREMLVWAVRHEACTARDFDGSPAICWDPGTGVGPHHFGEPIYVKCDGTPDSILAAVERAMGASSPSAEP
jgi:hypothetical protein